MAAERGLAAKGVNVTLIAQEPFTASVAGLSGQLLVSPKSLGLVPVMVMPLMLTAPSPLLLMVTPCALPVVFTVWLGNGTLEGDAAKDPPGVSPVAALKKEPGWLWLLKLAVT